MKQTFPYSAINAPSGDRRTFYSRSSGLFDPRTVRIRDSRTGADLTPTARNANGLPDRVELPSGVTAQMLQYALNACAAQASGHAPAVSGMPAALNASAALGLVPEERLTQFAIGYRPDDELQSTADFLSPRVRAPLKFSYRVHSIANAYATIDSDVVGIGGLPGLVVADEDDLVSAVLKGRGLETQMGAMEEQTHNTTPGWSAAMEWQDRIGMIMDSQRRGRIQRIMAIAVAAAGAATPKVWNSAADPIRQLRTGVKGIAQLVGGPAHVRVLIGSDVLEILVNHPKLAGGTNYARQAINEAEIARFIGVPPSNVQTNYLQVVGTKQGRTVVTTDLLSPSEVWIFACRQNPTRRDMSFMKTFLMDFGGSPWFVYRHSPHPLIVRRGNAYYEHIAVTNSIAVARWSVED